MKKNDERRHQIEEMTAIWVGGDNYARGYLNGIIEGVIHMTEKNETRLTPSNITQAG